jgi:endonuclease G
MPRERMSLLLDCQRQPVDDYGRDRNAAVAELQGNRDPLIDYPERAERIHFAASFRG